MADDQEKQGAGVYESESDVARTKAAFVKRWLEEIELASEEEKKWRKTSKEARDLYEAGEDAPEGKAFNIYYANIETLRPALYNSQPIPDVRRRYGDKDPTAKQGSDAIERCLSYAIDNYDFDGTIKEAIDDLSITGRGLARVTLEEEIVEVERGVSDVGYQAVGCDSVPWASFRRGPARTWSKVPWVAFAHYMTREQMVALSPEHGPKVPLDMVISSKGEASKDGAGDDNPESDVFKRALVWEIWDKDKRNVLHIAPSYSIDVLATTPDPLGLKDFFPVPCPMMTGKTSGRLVPLSPYKIYKPILDEIDVITTRVKALIKQLRPRAIGPGGVDMTSWATAGDGEIVEVQDVMQFLERGGMDKMLAWFPMEPTIKAIEALYLRREQAKQELFEVSGLADIMRGQSNAQETKGAQEIKQKWGSLRIQKSQAEVQRFIRDIFRLKAEIIAEKFTPENIAAMTGLEMSEPAIALIKDEKMRGYRIDVETDSTIRGDLTRNQEAMAQFVQGSAQYFAAVAPIVQAGGMSKQAAVTIYSAFARNFKLGKEVDAVLDSLADEAAKADQAPQEQANPEMEKAKAEIQKGQFQMQVEGERLKMDQAKAAGEQQVAMQKEQREAANMEREYQLKERLAWAEFGMKRDLAMLDAQLSQQTAAQDAQIKSETADQQMRIQDRTAQQNTAIKAQQARQQAKARQAGASKQ